MITTNDIAFSKAKCLLPWKWQYFILSFTFSTSILWFTKKYFFMNVSIKMISLFKDGKRFSSLPKNSSSFSFLNIEKVPKVPNRSSPKMVCRVMAEW